AQKANVITGVRERALSERPSGITEPTADRQTVLLFATQDGGRMAIPLSLVDRLEEFPRSSIERVGPQGVVQDRDDILPLVPVSRVLRGRSTNKERGARGEGQGRSTRRSSLASRSSPSDPVQVVVYAGKGQRVGLVVDRIIDIAEESLVSRSKAHRP